MKEIINKLTITPPEGIYDSSLDYDALQNENVYFLYHKEELVLEVLQGYISVHVPEKLPFDLRHYSSITYEHWLSWLKRRISTISRSYLNQLYKQRRLGRGHVEVINDSAAISITDLFWVTRPHLSHTWSSLQVMRDNSLSTVKASLEGILDEKEMNKIMAKGAEDHTSTLTVKGAFAKAVYLGHILKKRNNAEYEVSTYKFAYKIGFDVAKAETYEDGKVACELFTSEQTSLTHALEFLYPFDPETTKDIYIKALNKFSDNSKIYKQLQRLFILNYLVANFDFHGENFGFLYDTTTFEIISVAPGFDFNSAYDFQEDALAYDEDIFERLPEFVSCNTDLISGLKKIREYLYNDPYLDQTKKDMIVKRADYLVSLSPDT